MFFVKARRKKFIDTETTKWLNDGLITVEQKLNILEKYTVKHNFVKTFSSIAVFFITIGLFFLELGVLGFISVNWDEAIKNDKVIMIILSYLTAVLFSEWHRIKGSFMAKIWRFLAGIIYGIGIFLISDLFHIYGPNTWSLLILLWFIGLIPVYLSTPDACQMAMIQILGSIYVIERISFFLSFFGISALRIRPSTTELLYDMIFPLEPLMVLLALWALWKFKNKSKKILHINIALTLFVCAIRLSMVFHRGLVFSIIAFVGLVMVIKHFHENWGFIILTIYGTLLTYPAVFLDCGLPQNAFPYISFSIATSSAILYLYKLSKGKILAGVSLVLLITRYAIDKLLSFSLRLLGLTSFGLILLSVGLWLDIRNSKLINGATSHG